MVTIFLIRHAAHALVGETLCGRMDGIGLSDAGLLQAKSLGGRVRQLAVDAVYTSPMQRARETADHLSPSSALCEGMNEIDFGVWTGRSFAALADDPTWRLWNTARCEARPPGGESMEEVRQRAMHELDSLCARHEGQRLAVVSHCDVIKAVLVTWLGMRLDDWWRFDISPASISGIVMWQGGGKVLGVNEVVAG